MRLARTSPVRLWWSPDQLDGAMSSTKSIPPAAIESMVASSPLHLPATASANTKSNWPSLGTRSSASPHSNHTPVGPPVVLDTRLEARIDVDRDQFNGRTGTDSFCDPTRPHPRARTDLEDPTTFSNRRRQDGQQPTDRDVARVVEPDFTGELTGSCHSLRQHPRRSVDETRAIAKAGLAREGQRGAGLSVCVRRNRRRASVLSSGHPLQSVRRYSRGRGRLPSP